MSDAVLVWALRTMLTIAVLIPLVSLTCRVFRYRPAVQHALWLIVLVKFVTPTVLVWTWPFGSIAERILHEPEPQLEFVPIETRESTDGDSSWSPVELESRYVASGFAASVSRQQEQMLESDEQATEDAAVVEAGASWMDRMAFLLLFGWGAGALVFGARQILIVRRQMRCLKHFQPAEQRIQRIADDVASRFQLRTVMVLAGVGFSSPAVVCWTRLRLVWPHGLRALPEAAVQSVIAHELAHVRRRDHFVSWVELLASTVWWWNPLYWFVRNQLRTTAEMACDAEALSAFPEHRCVYAETLLWLSARPKTGVLPLVVAVGSSTPSSFERRMSMIVSERASGKVAMPGIAAIAILGCLIVPTWSVAQTAEKPSTGTEGISDNTEVSSAAAAAAAAAGPDRVVKGELSAAASAAFDDPREGALDRATGAAGGSGEQRLQELIHELNAISAKSLELRADETQKEARKLEAEARALERDMIRDRADALVVFGNHNAKHLQNLRHIVTRLKAECDRDTPDPQAIENLLRTLRQLAPESDQADAVERQI